MLSSVLPSSSLMLRPRSGGLTSQLDNRSVRGGFHDYRPEAMSVAEDAPGWLCGNHVKRVKGHPRKAAAVCRSAFADERDQRRKTEFARLVGDLDVRSPLNAENGFRVQTTTSFFPPWNGMAQRDSG